MSFNLDRCAKRIGTWNVRSLSRPGKMANVIMEMKRMGVEVMGIAETWSQGDGSFTTQLPDNEEGGRYSFLFRGDRRKGVSVIVSEDVTKSVLMYEPISERIIVMRLQATPGNILIFQIYAPCEEAEEEEKERFYERLDQVIADFKKGRECLVVMVISTEK